MRGRPYLAGALLFALLALLTLFYPFDRQPPPVTLSPPAGDYSEAIRVEVASEEEGASLFLSLGEADPMPYLGPLTIKGDTVVSCFAEDRAGNRSQTLTARYRVKIDRIPPVTSAHPGGGTFRHPVSVRLESEEGATIRYTTDGSLPDEGSPVYLKPIPLRKDAVLRFFAVDEAGNAEEARREQYRVNIDTSRPVTLAEPAGGLFNRAVTVSLSAEEGATIYYTLDGSRPSRRSSRYSEPIPFQRSAVLRFFAVDEAGNTEEMREESYLIDTEPPSVKALPPAGTFGRELQVRLSASEPAELRYETGGREANMASSPYRGPLLIRSDTTVSFFAVDRAGNRSETVRARYHIDRVPPVVVARPAGGEYAGRIRVKLEPSEEGEVRYTLDGTTPGDGSSLYRGPINISRNTTVSFFAVDAVGNRGEVVRERYVLDSAPPRTTAEPAGGVFSGPLRVKLSSEEGAVIRFTVDGSTPGAASPVYRQPVEIRGDTVLKFFATDDSDNAEEIRQERYTFDTTPPSTSIDPPPGVYNRPVRIALRSEAGGSIFFRLEGAEGYSPYQGPFVLDKGGKVSYYAQDASGNREAVRVAEYTVDREPPRTTIYPAPGEYNPPIVLELRSEQGATVRYTLDGSEPGPDSPVFSHPLELESDFVVSFFAVDEAGNAEGTRRASFQVASGLWRDYSSGVFIHPSVLQGEFMWSGGEEGLRRVNIDSKRRKSYTSSSSNLVSDSVRALAVDRLGFVWVGTDRGLSQFDGRSNWVSYDYGDGLVSNYINCITVDRDGALWIGTDSGMSIYRNHAFTTLGTGDGLPHANVNDVAVDASGVYWIATDGGLVRYTDRVEKVFTSADGLPADRITAVAVDGRWNVWVGTGGRGAARYDGERWRRFGSAEGLAGEDVRVIAVDLSDNKWFGTDKGAFKFDGNSFSPARMPVYR